MPVLEPIESELWRLVRPKAPWPQSNEDVLRQLATHWSAASGEFAEAGSFSLSGLAGHWSDGLGKDFVTRAQGTLDATARTAEGLARTADHTTKFVAEVTRVKTDIRELVRGKEPTLDLIRRLLPGTLADTVLTPFVDGVASEVDTIVADGAGRVAGIPVGDTAPIPPPPPADASPREQAKYWQSLTEEQRLRLARERPDLVSGRDGFSALHKDIASRTLLDDERDRLTAQLAEVDRKLASPVGRGGPGYPAVMGQLRAERDEILGKLGGLSTVENRLNATTNDKDGSRAYLLGVSAQDDGRVILAQGNPDTAENVTTFVPGVNTTLSSIDTNLTTAENIRREAIRDDPNTEDTSVVTWLGYDPPNSIPGGLNPAPAFEGGRDLAAFQQGLRAAHQGAPAHDTVIGHSYGSTTAGIAARNYDMAVDDLAVVGSPGLGPMTGEASDLENVPAGHVWVGEARHDYIADLGSTPDLNTPLGPDPSSDDFGARSFRTDRPNPPGMLDGAHGSYFDNDPTKGPNPALRNLGDIAAGREPEDR